MSMESQADNSFPMEQRLILMNAAGNGEGKLGLAAVMCAEPELAWTPVLMEKRITSLQEPNPGWEITEHELRNYVLRRFMVDGLTRAIPGTEEKRRTTYKIKEEWTDNTLAFCGAFMGWTLDTAHNMSLLTLLGSSGKPGKPQSPPTRYSMFDQLLATPGMGQKELQDALEAKGIDCGSGGVYNHVKRLKALGILSVDSRMVGYNPDISIEPQVQSIIEEQDGRHRTPIHNVITSILQDQSRAAEGAATVVDLDRLVTLCQERLPDTDPYIIRRRIFSMERDAESRGWGFVRDPDHESKKMVGVSIDPARESAIADLCQRVHNLDDPEARAYYREKARAILADPDAFSELMAKAYQSSPNTHRDDNADLDTNIQNAVDALGVSDLNGVVTELRRRGLTAHAATVDKHLMGLIEDRRILPDRRSRYAGQQAVLHYRIPFPENERLTLLAYAGNHEAKLAFAAIIGTERQPRTIRHWHKRMMTMQGEPPVWPMGDRTIKTYLNLSFIPGGIVQEATPEGMVVPRYKIRDELTQNTLALAGTLMEWSLDPDNENISIQTLLGRTGTAGLRRAPEIRYRIYTHLLEEPNVSLADLSSALDITDYDPSSVHENVRTLGRLGILTVNSRVKRNNTSMQVLPAVTTYEHEKAHGEIALVPESDLIVRALARLYSMAAETPVMTDMDNLLLMCKTLDPDTDLSNIRRRITAQVSQNRSRFWRAVREKDYQPDKKVAVSIESAYKRPLADLCDRIAGLARPKARDHYATVAGTLVADSSAMYRLMEKALRFSSTTHAAEVRGDTALPQKVLDAVRILGTANAEQVVAHLHGAGGRTEITSVSAILRDFAQKEVLASEMRRSSPDKKREVPHFSLPPEPKQQTVTEE